MTTKTVAPRRRSAAPPRRSRAPRPQPDPEPSPPPGAVVIGSRVTTRDQAGVRTIYVVVRPGDADLTRGHVSAVSPVGAALLGHRAGETVELVAPGGHRTLTLLAVECGSP
jgi:transcription elongation GreA/GreB family factor